MIRVDDRRPTSCTLASEPPAESAARCLWRLAARLFRDHQPAAVVPASRTVHLRTVRVRQPWPCSGRRLAELGLTRARG